MNTIWNRLSSLHGCDNMTLDSAAKVLHYMDYRSIMNATAKLVSDYIVDNGELKGYVIRGLHKLNSVYALNGLKHYMGVRVEEFGRPAVAAVFGDTYAEKFLDLSHNIWRFMKSIPEGFVPRDDFEHIMEAISFFRNVAEVEGRKEKEA